MSQGNDIEACGFKFEEIQVSFEEPIPSVVEGHMAIQHILPGTSANLLTAVKAKVGEFPVFLVPTFGDLQGRTGNEIRLSDVTGGTFGEIVGVNSESSQIIAKMFYRNMQAGSLNPTLVQFPPGMDVVVVPNALLVERARGTAVPMAPEVSRKRKNMEGESDNVVSTSSFGLDLDGRSWDSANKKELLARIRELQPVLRLWPKGRVLSFVHDMVLDFEQWFNTVNRFRVFLPGVLSYSRNPKISHPNPTQKMK